MTLQAALLFPIICAVIGYSTKWIALKMVFKPDKFVGVGPIGWQGIIQRRADKFSVGIAETIQNAGLDASVLTEQIRGEELGAALETPISAAAPALARVVVDGMAPGTWDTLSSDRQQRAIDVISAETGPLVGDLVEVAMPEVASSIDMSGVVTDLLSGENAGRLAHLFRAIGEKEMRWMIRYGAVMGFVIGLLEVGAFALFDRWWLLPIVGSLDGLVNNWLAIQMIFLPRERTVYLGLFPYQGMFPARQKEISANFARVMAEEVLTPSNLMSRLSAADSLGEVAASVLPRVAPLVDNLLERLAKSIEIEYAAGMSFQVMAALATPEAGAALAPVVTGIESYLGSAIDFESLLEQGLAAMPKEQFETVLRGIFQEDEATLIGLGAVIGGAIGCLQAVIAVALGFV